MLTNHERIMKARGNLIMNQPFFGVLAMNLHIVEDETTLGTYEDGPDKGKQYPTFSTDGTALYYHPEAPEQYTDMEMLSVLGHEVLHLAGKHHVRLYGRDHDDWNTAADYIVNSQLKEAGFHLPDHWYYDDKYTGLSVDEVYAQIHKKPGPGGAGGGGGGQGPGQQQVNKSQQAPGGVRLPKNTDPKKADKTPSQTDLQAEDQKWTQLVSQAKTAADLSCGNIPGNVRRMIKDILEPRVDWRNVLREFVDRVVHNDYTFTRPNRRYMHTGIILPTLYNKEVGRIAVVIDSSISTASYVQQFCSEISTILMEFDPEEIAVFDVDTRMHGDPVIFTKDDLPIKFDVKGYGGTRFSPAFEWIRDNADTYDEPLCLIYLTDLGSSDYPDFEPSYPTLWVNTEKTNWSTPPFGEIVYMNPPKM